MKKYFLTLLLFTFYHLFLPEAAHSQVGISYHQSSLPFVGVGYTFSEKFSPELRLGTDRYFEDVTFEAVFNFHFLRREDYRFYAGFGIHLADFGGSAVVPLGIQLFPLENKRFGFHIEAAPIIGERSGFFRGSWGIRYRFLRE